ncbi:MAG: sigma 54-interacting transcriptional regulator [Myxococcales bacterium]
MAQAASAAPRRSWDPGGALGSLLEVSAILASPLDLRPAVEGALAKLARDAGVVRAAVLVLDAGSSEIRVDVSLGFDPEAQRTSRKLGQGIVGRVVESGRAAFAAPVAREPLFSAAGGERASNGTFLCLPLAEGGQPLGALAIELLRGEVPLPKEARRFFTVVATMISQAFQIRRRFQDGTAPSPHERLPGIVGISPSMCRVCEQIAKIARTDAAVLLRGEAGTGKELIARVIHRNSPRARAPFLTVNVGTATDSGLFGQEQGSSAPKQCGLELAAGGTVFLDEVGDLGAAAQARLLRVLRENQFERVGGGETLHADVRVIAASNKDLERAVASYEFQKELLRRLVAVTIFVPPLRERDSDVLMLADHFLARYSREHGKRVRRIAQPAIDLLTSYRWPGNVRELENAVERAVLVCESGSVHAYHLPPALQMAETPRPAAARASLSESVQAYEKEVILDALKTARGNRLRAARLLETTERILGYKIRKYGIDTQRFRDGG